MDKHTPEQRHKNMQAIKSSNSKIELMLRHELWALGLHYRKNVKTIYGHPDIAFIGKKIAVFCDSEFWHGYEWDTQKNNIKSRRDFWFPKIERNIHRDREVNDYLKANGWTVIRFWGNDIKQDALKCAEIVNAAVKEKVK